MPYIQRTHTHPHTRTPAHPHTHTHTHTHLDIHTCVRAITREAHRELEDLAASGAAMQEAPGAGTCGPSEKSRWLGLLDGRR